MLSVLLHLMCIRVTPYLDEGRKRLVGSLLCGTQILGKLFVHFVWNYTDDDSTPRVSLLGICASLDSLSCHFIGVCVLDHVLFGQRWKLPYFSSQPRGMSSAPRTLCDRRRHRHEKPSSPCMTTLTSIFIRERC